MTLHDLNLSAKYWRTLLTDANWSKCVYTYALATCLVQSGDEKNLTEAKTFMTQVPGLMQRIAGKSIPLEVYFPILYQIIIR